MAGMPSDEFEKWKDLVHKVLANHFTWAFARSRDDGKLVVHYLLPRSIDRDDLLQEGYIGLLEAWKTYNPKHKSRARFITYAYRAIYRRMATWVYQNAGPVSARKWRWMVAGASPELQQKMMAAVYCGLFSEISENFTTTDAREDLAGHMESVDRQDFIEHCMGKLKSCMSQREWRVLSKRMAGKSYEEIGRSLHMDRRRVSQYVNRLMIKAASHLYAEGVDGE